jgi:putative RecB family exonuclease
LSPSKVSTFTDCAFAFRLANIDKVREEPSPAAVRGTLVHRALQLLFGEEDPGARTLAAARAKLRRAVHEMEADPEYLALGLGDEEAAGFRADAEALVRRYFELEDPNEVRVIGVELLLEARIGPLVLRGIIDRLELDADGGLVITDYKTGRAPGAAHELPRMAGVQFYALLCEQALRRRPARLQLLHLDDPVAISLVPSEQSMRGLQHRAEAVWDAIARACADDDFRPNVSGRCEWCSYKAYCPAFGGDPAAIPERPAPPAERPVDLVVTPA